MSKRLLVTGATGKQGGALIAALLEKPDQPFEIYALTRAKDSSSAQKLAKLPNVKIVEGNLDDIPSVFKQIPTPVHGVFAVPVMDKGLVVEEKQGKSLTYAATKAGVSHLVFTTTDRGGQLASENNPTNVAHFASKYRVEEHIKAQASKIPGMKYTFLRPVAFYENMSNDFIGRAFAAMWRQTGPECKLQLISTRDIGKVAADAFLNPDSPEYKNAAVSLAGDELSVNEAARIFKEETGQTMPETSGWIGSLIKLAITDMKLMFTWFKTDGFGVDVPAMKQRYPFMKDFRTWLREESAWKKGAAK